MHASNGTIGHILNGDPYGPVEGIFSPYEIMGHDLDYMESIEGDDAGNLWALADRGLYKLNRQQEAEYFSFDYTDFERSFYSFEFLDNGKLVFGMKNRIALMDPFEIKRNEYEAIPYIKDVNVLEKTLPGNPGMAGQELRLKANENFVSFYFSSLSYTLADKNRILYKLDGFDPDWIEAGKRRFVNYTNIPSGDYTFQLKAANNEGIWNEIPVELRIHIATPWYDTALAKIAFVLLVGSLIYFLYRYRITQIRKEAKMKSEFEKKLANTELSALRAQMNPHFIFNSLNSIESYIIKNEPFKAAEYINDFARLMRLILQNSRSQYVRLQDEIESLDLYLMMESLRFENKFEYQINLSDEIKQGRYEIPPMLIQPYVENAIWHGLMHKEEGGRVDIDISRNNGMLRCVIEDNGIGRKKSFEMKKNKRTRGKKSMGMQITEDRIQTINELYNTNTRVQIIDKEDESGQGTGTTIVLEIPV